jgi:hypothetical protein
MPDGSHTLPNVRRGFLCGPINPSKRSPITLRQGTRVIEDSRRLRVV